MHAFGLNYRLTDIACALGLSQLRRLDAFAAPGRDQGAVQRGAGRGRRRCARRRSGRDVDPAWHLYPVRVLDGRRREVFERMRAAGIGVQVNYIPVYWHPVYADLGYRRGMCPNAEAFYEQELSLPMFPDLTDDQVDQVVETLTTILRLT